MRMQQPDPGTQGGPGPSRPSTGAPVQPSAPRAKVPVEWAKWRWAAGALVVLLIVVAVVAHLS